MTTAKTEESEELRLLLDSNFINSFVRATVNALQTMAGVKKVAKQNMTCRLTFRKFGDIVGVIGLSGHTAGCIAISFEQDLANSLVAQMLETEPEKLTPEEVSDGVGELVNMISGAAKAELAANGFRFDLALPTVITGKEQKIAHKQGLPCLVISFTADGQKFILQVSVDIKRSS